MVKRGFSCGAPGVNCALLGCVCCIPILHHAFVQIDGIFWADLWCFVFYIYFQNYILTPMT